MYHLDPDDRACHPDVLRQSVFEFKSGAWRLESYQATEVRRKLRKRIVFCRLSYHDTTKARARTTRVVAKVYGRDKGARALEALRKLREAGFRPPQQFQVPRPLGYSAEEATLVQEAAPGIPWFDHLTRTESEATAASVRAAEWLIRLQQSGVSTDPSTWEDDVARVQRLAAELVQAYPEQACRLREDTDHVLRRLPWESMTLVPSHGDYHLGNVLLTARVTTVIDLDTFALREPAFDVGYGIGQALIMSYLHLGELSSGARAALAFWQRYQGGGKATWPRVAAHVARTLLQSLHYELCVLHTNRVELIDRWMGLMEKWLDSKGPETLEALVDHRPRLISSSSSGRDQVERQRTGTRRGREQLRAA